MTATITSIRRLPSIPVEAMHAVELAIDVVLENADRLRADVERIIGLAPQVGGAITPRSEGHAPCGSKPPGPVGTMSIDHQLSKTCVYWLHYAGRAGLDVTPADLDTTVGVLLSRVAAAADQLAQWTFFDLLAKEFADLARQCHASATTRPPDISLGYCPEIVDGVTCGTPLVAHAAKGWVTCRGCKTQHRVDEWRANVLKADQGPLLTVPEGAREVHRVQGIPVTPQHLARLLKAADKHPADDSNPRAPKYKRHVYLEVMEAHRCRHDHDLAA